MRGEERYRVTMPRSPCLGSRYPTAAAQVGWGLARISRIESDMPTYVYEIVKPDGSAQPGSRFEVEQSIKADALACVRWHANVRWCW